LAPSNCICDPMDLAALGHMTNCPARASMTDHPNPTPAPSVAFDEWREAERENLIAAGLGNTTVHVLRIAFYAGWSARPSPSVESFDPVAEEMYASVFSRLAAATHAQEGGFTKERVEVSRIDLIMMLTDLEARRATARAQSATGAVEGEWVTVPREPTEAMLRACATALKDYIDNHTTREERQAKGGHTGYRVTAATKAAVRYRAMIAAVPTLPAREWTDEQVEAAVRKFHNAMFVSELKQEDMLSWMFAFRDAFAALPPTDGHGALEPLKGLGDEMVKIAGWCEANDGERHGRNLREFAAVIDEVLRALPPTAEGRG
jgi:hypothetical protein